jgi:signal peptidase II
MPIPNRSAIVPSTPASPPPAARFPRSAIAFWSVFPLTVTADVVTKHLAEARLPLHVPLDVLGEWIRLTLTYNTGAAMNLSAGAASRVVFTIVASLMLVVIFRMYRRTAQHDATQAVALALIAAGALGNLIDRLRSARGVVDFIDVGAGDVRFWTFNVADAGVTVGAVLLALVLLRQPATLE